LIVHVVLIQPKTDLTEYALAAALSDLEKAAIEIPSIKRARVGRRIRHGLPGYEQAMTRDFTYAAFLEFEDRGGLEAYLRHPAHAALSRHFATLGEVSLAYDYETDEVEKKKSSTMARS
jgi:hypothetical protein